MPTSDELVELAERCVDAITRHGSLRHTPAFSDVEELCEAEYDALLGAMVFAPVDIARQEALVEQIAAALPDAQRSLIVELADNHARHVWLQQEGAFHLGFALGRHGRARRDA
jgi:hypothetical protein